MYINDLPDILISSFNNASFSIVNNTSIFTEKIKKSIKTWRESQIGHINENYVQRQTYQKFSRSLFFFKSCEVFSIVAKKCTSNYI